MMKTSALRPIHGFREGRAVTAIPKCQRERRKATVIALEKSRKSAEETLQLEWLVGLKPVKDLFPDDVEYRQYRTSKESARYEDDVAPG